MSEKKVFSYIYNQINSLLDEMIKHPDKVTEDDEKKLNGLYSKLCQTLGISEHSQWRVEWKVDKWFDTARKLAGFEPDETAIAAQNIILDSGANEMLKLIVGDSSARAYSHDNSFIYVGSDSTDENASQVGLIASGDQRAYAAMDTGYPSVNGRQMVFRASFGDSEANFDWREVAIANSNGGNAVFMNRKVPDNEAKSLGTKTTGTWTIQITISLTSST